MTSPPPARLRGIDLIDEVLTIAGCVPPGTLVTYGDIAELAGTGPRAAGAVLARAGAGVPWWRVTNARGMLPPHLLPAAQERWRAEGITWRPGGGARIGRHRADLPALAAAVEAARGQGQAGAPPPG